MYGRSPWRRHHPVYWRSVVSEYRVLPTMLRTEKQKGKRTTSARTAGETARRRRGSTRRSQAGPSHRVRWVHARATAFGSRSTPVSVGRKIVGEVELVAYREEADAEAVVGGVHDVLVVAVSLAVAGAFVEHGLLDGVDLIELVGRGVAGDDAPAGGVALVLAGAHREAIRREKRSSRLGHHEMVVRDVVLRLLLRAGVGERGELGVELERGDAERRAVRVDVVQVA